MSIGNNNENTSVDNDNIIVTDTSYTSSCVAININTLREYDTSIYIADVVIKDISYLHAGLANGVFGRNITAKTSEIAGTASVYQTWLSYTGIFLIAVAIIRFIIVCFHS